MMSIREKMISVAKRFPFFVNLVKKYNAEQAASPMFNNMQVQISLEGNVISVALSNVPIDAQYACELYYFPIQDRPKTLVSRVPYAQDRDFRFQTGENGYYFARCYVQKGTKRVFRDSYTVLYLDHDFEKRFKTVITKDLHSINTINEPIGYFKLPAPSNDFCLVSTKETISLSSLERLGQAYGYGISEVGGNSLNSQNYLLHDISGIQHGCSNNCIFSGYAWVNGQFIFGQDNLPDSIDSHNLFDCCGIFTLLQIDDNSIRISSDFFGYSRLFIYKTEQVLLVANRYHLLLSVLSALEEPCELDPIIVRTTFASNVTLLRQTFTERLVVKNTEMLNICNYVEIDKKGWHFPKKKIHSVLSGSAQYDEDAYRQCIDQGASDIISNVRALYNSSFEHVVLDLSGGKDSRATVAAATHFPGSKERFTVRSDAWEPDDLEVAIGINNHLGFHYYTKGDLWYQNSPLDYLRKKRSYFCGYHYLWFLEKRHSGNPGKLRVSGESFESSTVRYYSKTVESLSLEKASISELVDAYSILLSKQPIINYSNVSQDFNELLENELQRIPAETSLESFDNMLLFFRGSTHAGNLDRNYYISACCMPLQSPALLEAKKMWINNFTENKVIWDVMNKLNPDMAAMPYNSKKNNESRDAAGDIILDPQKYKGRHIPLNTDPTTYEKEMALYYNNTKTITTPSDSEEINRLGTIPQIVMDNCLLGLQKLAEYDDGAYSRTCMEILYYLLQMESDDDEIRILHNKIMSILDCIDAIEGRVSGILLP